MIIRCEPFSESEQEVIIAFSECGVKDHSCRLGALWGKPYNEYFVNRKYNESLIKYLEEHQVRINDISNKEEFEEVLNDVPKYVPSSKVCDAVSQLIRYWEEDWDEMQTSEEP